MHKDFNTHSGSLTSIGNPTTWPQSLKTALNILLNVNFPTVLLWGADHVCFFNDSYIAFGKDNMLEIPAYGLPPNNLFYDGLGLSKKDVDEIMAGKQGMQRATEQALFSIKSKRENVSYNFHHVAIYNDTGVPEGVMVTYNEVSDIDKSIHKLRLRDQQFRNLIHQATVGIIVLIGEEMRIEIVNEMYGKLIGRVPAELYGKNIFDVIPEAEKDFKPIIERVCKTGKPLFLYDKPYTVTAHGERIEGYLNLVYQPSHGPDGSINGVMVLCQDVTAQVLDKKNIVEAEEKARLAIDSADLCTYEINLLTDEMKTSDRFNKVLGVENRLARPEFSSLIHPDDLEIREAAHRESVITGKLDYEARVIWKDKSIHWVKVKGKVLYDHTGTPSTLLGIIQDVTEQKAIADNLNQLVQERTKEFQSLNEELVAMNEELSDSNDHLVAANKELEQFAYVASHDLQEPLRKIQIFTSILNQNFATELSVEASSYLNKITSSATRMSNLIKDLLDYSRLAFNSTLFRQTDLNEIVTNVINDFELLVSQKGATIHVDSLASIEAIPIQMNQLFYNLIGNSIKFSKKGVKPVIAITTRLLRSEDIQYHTSLTRDSHYREIVVSDNGIGFSQQYAEQIFAIFQRLNNRSKYGGYGIGLAVCKRIVENHNGIIFAKGEENRGATFVVILPIEH